MDAVTLINQNIDVEKLLEHYDFGQIRTDSLMIRCACAIHGGSNSTAFVINSETGLWYCHTGGCGGGDVFTLVQKLEKVEFPQSVEIIADIFGIDIHNLEIREREETYLVELKQWIKAMKNRKTTNMPEYSISEEIKEVAKFRSFNQETLEYFKLGYVESVKLKRAKKQEDGNDFYTLKNRLVMPIYHNGKQVGLSFRRTKSKDYPKFG